MCVPKPNSGPSCAPGPLKLPSGPGKRRRCAVSHAARSGPAPLDPRQALGCPPEPTKSPGACSIQVPTSRPWRPHSAPLSAPATPPPPLRALEPKMPSRTPGGRKQETLFLPNAKPKRGHFSTRQGKGDQIRRSRKTRLDRLQSSQQARMEPQSYLCGTTAPLPSRY